MQVCTALGNKSESLKDTRLQKEERSWKPEKGSKEKREAGGGKKEEGRKKKGGRRKKDEG